MSERRPFVKLQSRDDDPVRKYEADDADLPGIFSDRPTNTNRLAQARIRISAVIDELGLSVTKEEIATFAIVLYVLEEAEGSSKQ
jgi:hypothetical protein